MTDDILARLTRKANNIVGEARQRIDHEERDLSKSAHVRDPDGHLYSVGDRITISLKLVDKFGPFPGEYGDRWGYKFFQHETCNVVMWWSGTSPGINIGETAEFKGTLKEYGEYQGVQQTTLTRVKKQDPRITAAKRRREDQEGEDDDGPVPF